MFNFNLDEMNYPYVHFIGIGGISMSGLAEILLNSGYKVSGSDSKKSDITIRLEKLGGKVYIDHNRDNINEQDLIIYTDAISKDNEEYLAALEKKIPTIDRASFLGALMKNYTNSIAVSGTHGKTTTTSILSTIFNKTNLEPTILLGGNLDNIKGNVRLGKKDYIISEACEYKANILKYFPTMAIILNIDEDHLDFFKSISHIQDTFVQYGENLDKDNYLVINYDDANCKRVIETTKAKVVTFGFHGNADYRAQDIVFIRNGYADFNLNIKGEKYPIKMSVMGIHNIYNALAAIAAAHIHGIDIPSIQEGIMDYKGTHRRLEYKGLINNILVIDDYAHHPTEIRAALEAVKNSTTNNIYCIFQPHTYTRTLSMLDSFSKSFEGAKQIIIPDIYAAREKNNGSVHSKDLVKALKEKGYDAIYMSSFEDIKNHLLETAAEGDIVITMGAGNVYEIGEMMLEENRKEAI